MSDIAINVEGLSKQYRIGERESYKALRDVISDAASAPFRRLRSVFGNGSATNGNGHEIRNSQSEIRNSFWALDDVSFEVKRGEVVGIIGRNGAGKSTLLKILSRITKPTKGHATIHGRVGSLLEVGTGFHPELTGRENIYLNAAILGMRKAEVARKFDEIVAFAEVDKFIDTPVKRYSSGMYVRLAFAVAAHMDTEILLVDEVLAVGDARFQRKCFDKMHDVGEQGRTVIFISHSMPSVMRLCPRTILMDNGRVLRDDLSYRVVNAYLGSGLGTSTAREWVNLTKAPGNDIARLSAVRVRGEDGEILDAADIRKPIGVEIEYEVLKEGHVLVPNLHFYNEEGVCLFISIDLNESWRQTPRTAGRHLSTAWIPGNLFAEGTVFVGVALSTINPTTVHFFERDAVAFQVIDSVEGDSARGDWAEHLPGVVRPMFRWTEDFYQEDVSSRVQFSSSDEKDSVARQKVSSSKLEESPTTV